MAVARAVGPLICPLYLTHSLRTMTVCDFRTPQGASHHVPLKALRITCFASRARPISGSTSRSPQPTVHTISLSAI
eukprot:3843473-Rhodomonas_salina.1